LSYRQATLNRYSLPHPLNPKQRFSLHDLKRQGVTDTPDTFAEKQTVAGLTEAMMEVYDFSLPRVSAAAG